MGVDSLLRLLGDQVQAPDEETFDLFAQQFASQNLGFIDSKAKTLELTVAGRDLTIHQSPAILSSSRAGGTTGAVVWKITPLFAEWISSPTNPLFTHEILTGDSSIIELGCGIAGIVGLLVAPRVSNYILTDQIYVAKLLEQNLTSNKQETTRGKFRNNTPKQRASSKQSKSQASSSSSPNPDRSGQIRFHPLDWETDTPTPSLLTPSTSKSFDVIIACDCIYNEALVEPFVSTCVDICKLKLQDSDSPSSPCVCIVAQHLRDPSVFEAFITTFTSSFHAWRVPDSLLLEGLRSNLGLVVHMGVFKGTIPEPEPRSSSGGNEDRR